MSKKIPWIASTKVLQLTSLRPPINIEHRSGLLHGNADALSRHPCLPDGCRHCDQLQDRLAPRTGDPTDVDTQPQVFRVVFIYNNLCTTLYNGYMNSLGLIRACTLLNTCYRFTLRSSSSGYWSPTGGVPG